MNESDVKRLVARRVEVLFGLARDAIHDDPRLAQRYVGMARKIAMAVKLPLKPELRRQVCRHCKSFILPGVNCRVRVRSERESHVVVTCLNCGGTMRMPLKKKKEIVHV